EDGRVLDARVLNGDLNPPYTGQFNHQPFNSFGFGPPREYLTGLPHFRRVEFDGRFPIAELSYTDDAFPGFVRQRAFNPFIPGNGDDSSIPGAFFEIEITNTREKPIDYTVALSVGSPFSETSTLNRFDTDAGRSLLTIRNNSADPATPEYGDITLGTDAGDVSYQEYWYRGHWYDNLTVYWNDLTKPGPFTNRRYREGAATAGWKTHTDHALLAAHVSVRPAASEVVRFVVTWNFPVFKKYWKTEFDRPRTGDGEASWNNYYASLFESSRESAAYGLSHWSRLRGSTVLFRDTLFSSTLPECVIDAVASNLSTLKSPTAVRLEDGTFYGWEGCHPQSGCCEGSCTHVWNYAYALPFLFPSLERSMREATLTHNLGPAGDLTFRLTLPLGRERWNFRPCVDGQFGEIIKFYREWKISGDMEWLRRYWPVVISTLEYAWSPENPDEWDRARSGVIRGRQHHTLDMELFGPNAWLTGLYLAALKAASEMASALGEEERAHSYHTIFEKGYRWVKTHLFNGEYFVQHVDLRDRSLVERYSEGTSLVGDAVSAYWDEEHGEIKYQLAGGSHIDQVLAGWHATLTGLGEIYDPVQYRSALTTILRRNFKGGMRDFANPCRVFCLNDERGVVICDYGNDRPAVGVPYAEETMNGFEYAFAAQLISSGMVEEGVEVVEAIRDRYDGHKRNPWNEFECGSNYARSMASYSLLLVFSGFAYDVPNGSIAFSPPSSLEKNGTFRSFWALGGAWGVVSIDRSRFELTVHSGALEVRRIGTGFLRIDAVTSVTIDRDHVPYRRDERWILLDEPLVVDVGRTVRAEAVRAH
ncbi:MAG: non-lysosomal glucosylceramidase, partial [Spirochaetales bacterium]|nr:non-lysosomal glucosylceramidase [Spirochaetales bacterium]